jgi:hypothetical protein
VTEPGIRTEDIRAIHKPANQPIRHPDDRILHRNGLIGFITGTAFIVGAGVLCLVFYITTDGHLFTDHDGQVFAILGLMIGATLGGSLIVIAAGCSLHARTRARTRDLDDNVTGNRRRLDQLASEVHDLEATVRTAVNAVIPVYPMVQEVGERMESMQAQLAPIEAALDAIAEHLPDLFHRTHWRGYNAAVREGFAESNGTDNMPRQRPGHLGLVPNEEPGETP